MRSPTHGLSTRATSQDEVFQGVEVPAGSLLHLRFGAANVDEEEFACRSISTSTGTGSPATWRSPRVHGSVRAPTCRARRRDPRRADIEGRARAAHEDRDRRIGQLGEHRRVAGLAEAVTADAVLGQFPPVGGNVQLAGLASSWMNSSGTPMRRSRAGASRPGRGIPPPGRQPRGLHRRRGRRDRDPHAGIAAHETPRYERASAMWSASISSRSARAAMLRATAGRPVERPPRQRPTRTARSSSAAAWDSLGRSLRRARPGRRDPARDGVGVLTTARRGRRSAGPPPAGRSGRAAAR